MSEYNPLDFESVIKYLRRELGLEAFRNPSRLFSLCCDLAPKLKPYANIARQLVERGVLSGLETAFRKRDTREQDRMMMNTRYVLENELLLSADKVEYFLTIFGNLYSAETFEPEEEPAPEPAPEVVPETKSAPEPAPEVIPEAKPAPEVVPETKPAPEVVPEAKPAPEVVPEAKPAPEVVPEAQPAPETEPLAQPVTQPRVLPMSGYSGAVAWSLDSDGGLTVSGHGEMEDYIQLAYHQSTAPWSGRQSEIASVVIEDGVTSVGQEAFAHCVNLQSVRISDSVTKIGDMAFRASGLRRVAIPGGVKVIGASAFDSCADLKSVTILRGVERIEGYAFAECGNLSAVTIPNSVRRIAYRAFRNCANLNKAYVPADTQVDEDAFDFHTAVVRW